MLGFYGLACVVLTDRFSGGANRFNVVSRTCGVLPRICVEVL